MKKIICAILLLCFSVAMLSSCSITELFHYETIISVEYGDIGDKALFERRLNALALETIDSEQNGTTVEYVLESHYKPGVDAVMHYGDFDEVAIIDGNGNNVFDGEHTAEFEFNGRYITAYPSDSFFEQYDGDSEFKIAVGELSYPTECRISKRNKTFIISLVSFDLDYIVYADAVIGLTSEPANGDIKVSVKKTPLLSRFKNV